jgi:hypothetical protein
MIFPWFVLGVGILESVDPRLLSPFNDARVVEAGCRHCSLATSTSTTRCIVIDPFGMLLQQRFQKFFHFGSLVVVVSFQCGFNQGGIPNGMQIPGMMVRVMMVLQGIIIHRSSKGCSVGMSHMNGMLFVQQMILYIDIVSTLVGGPGGMEGLVNVTNETAKEKRSDS